MTITRLGRIYGRQKTVLVVLVELGGEATAAELRERIGDFVGGNLHALRNRSLIEPWMDVIRVTPAGLALYREIAS